MTVPNYVQSERRFLIAIGTASYEHLPAFAQLPGVVDEIALIVELFTNLGYQRELTELSLNPIVQRAG